MKWVWTCAAWFVALLVSAGSHAQQVAFRVEYRAAPTCPGVDVFSSQVVERSRQLRLAAPAEPASVFELELSEREQRFAGVLRLREQNGRTTEREVASSSCEEVVSALALIAAVLLDPASDQATGAPAAAAVSERPSRRRDATARPARRVRAKPAPRQATPANVGDEGAQTPARKRPHTPVRFGAGLGVALEDAVSPAVSPGFFAELDAVVDGGGVFEPLIAVQLTRTLTSRAETEAGTAELTWTAARLLGCPVQWPPGDEFLAVRPCVSGEAGQLAGSGSNTTGRAESEALWLALGFGARLEARPAAGFRITLDGGAVVPLTRDRFFFEPDTQENTAFEVPAAGASGRLALIVMLN